MIRILLFLAALCLAIPAHSAGITELNVGLVINCSGRSIDEGRYVKIRGGIPDRNVFHVCVAEGKGITETAFLNLSSNLKSQLVGRDDIKVLALAWAMPFKAGYNGITSALAMGIVSGYQVNPTFYNPFYDSDLSIPPNIALNDSGTGRLVIQVLGQSTEDTVKLVDDGIASDATNPATAIAIIATDPVNGTQERRVRGRLWVYRKEPMQIGPVRIVLEPANHASNIANVMFYFQGNDTLDTTLDPANNVQYLKGSIADDLDSYSGIRHIPTAAKPLSNALEGFIRLGAQGSIGPVSEPYLYEDKFLYPKAVIRSYIKGEPQVVALWKGIRRPFNSNMIGWPMACPWCPTKGPDIPAPKPVGNACTNHWKLYIKEPTTLAVGSSISWSVLGGNGAVVKQGATKVTTGGLINFGAILDFPVEGPASLMMQPGSVRQLCNVVIWS